MTIFEKIKDTFKEYFVNYYHFTVTPHVETVVLIEKKQIEIKVFHDLLIKYCCVLTSLGK